MKQMRSRFRLITLLLVCAFLVVLGICAGSTMKAAGITLDSLSSLPLISTVSSPEPSVSPDASPDGITDDHDTPSPPEVTPAGSVSPGTDNSPLPEYNVFGL